MDNSKQDYGELLGLKQKLQAKVEALKLQLEDAMHQYDSVSTTLELLGQKSSDLAQEYQEFTAIPPSLLKGLTQLQALEKIAKANNGRFKIKIAKRLMLAAHLIANPQNAYNIIYNVIHRSEKFRRVGPGEYELIEDTKKALTLLEASR